ncbi:ester cyclase [Streptomyces sp. S186]|uniref:ester cyclase n=1 Tax=Streptomyces sp. S186 TaxID=3434395 RepID=UPI003F67F592
MTASVTPAPAHTSVHERNKELALSMVAAWNRGELEGITRHWSPDIQHFSEDRPVDSRRMVAAMRGGLAAFPGLRLECRSIVAEGDRVILRITVTATHGGDFLGKKATGRKVTWYMLEELRFDDAGRVIEHYDVFNYLPMLKELGFVDADVM